MTSCTLFGHKWGMWFTILKGSLKARSLDTTVVDVGAFETQRKVCDNCGLAKLITHTSSIDD